MFSLHLRKIQIAFLSLGSLATYSCTDPELVSLPFSGPKIVLQVIGVTTNDSTFLQVPFYTGWNLELSLSSPVLVPPYLSDCDSTWYPEVEITDAEDTALVANTAMYRDQCYLYYQKYTLDSLFPYVESGKTYHITVYDNQGRSVNAQYTHPPLVAIKILKVDHMGPGVNEFGWSGNFYEITVELDDPKDKINFYELSIDYYYDVYSSQQMLFEFNDPSFIQSPTGLLTRDGWLFDDQPLNPSKKSITLKAFLSDHSRMDEAPTEEHLVVLLRNYSPELYQFYHDLHIQQLAEEDRNGTPMPIRSNVEGGLGVVGGYAEYRHMIPVEFHKNR